MNRTKEQLGLSHSIKFILCTLFYVYRNKHSLFIYLLCITKAVVECLAGNSLGYL